MPDPRQDQERRRDPRAAGAHRQRTPAVPRHARSISAAALAQQQRQARLARTVVATIVVLALASALSGYLLHGPGQSDARAQSSGSMQGTAATTAPRPSSTSASPLPSVTSRSEPSASSPARASDTKPATTKSASATPTGHRTTRTRSTSVPAKGNGKFTPVSVPQKTTATSGRVVTYSLQVEGGMHADTAVIAKTFGNALLDRRGWQGVDKVRFVQVTPKQIAKGRKPQMRVLLASPDRVDSLCAPLPTNGKTSCDTSAHVVLNYKLWVHGVSYYEGHVAKYREYMVNHEVGHALGHGHQQCSKKGAYAPVMQQQTLGLHGCKAWPWPQRPGSSRS